MLDQSHPRPGLVRHALAGAILGILLFPMIWGLCWFLKSVELLLGGM